MDIIERPSPNHAPRGAASVDILVLHYTELPLQQSLDILSDGGRAQKVSAHYVLAEDGIIFRLVPENRTAWHAGRSWWRGREALNATSIGIEIVNLHGDQHDYPAAQIEALITLCRDIQRRHPAIVARNVVGHSDIAPRRKIDPGVRFPWTALAEADVGLFPRKRARPLEGDVQAALQRYGYPAPNEIDPADIVMAFQRHFRPSNVDGLADPETRALLADLLDQVGGQA